MNNIVNGLGSGLLHSGLVLLMALLLIHITRKVLIRLNYSRIIILRLWLAVPVSLLVCFVAMKWPVGQYYIEPMTLRFPPQVQALSQSGWFDIDWTLALLLVWMIAAGWKLSRLIHQYVKTKNTFLKHIELMHVEGHHNVYSSDLDVSPMAFGLLKPMIVVPQKLISRLTQSELQLVILHESIHCRRADPLWRFALACLNGIYWFLPGFNFSREAFIEDQELACDEQVISQSQQLSVYAQLLLSLNRNQTRRAPNETVYCSASFNLKERIMKLNQVNKKKHQTSIISLFLLSAFAISSWSAMAQVVTDNGGDIVLTPTHRASPMYPFTAVKEKISGQVTVEFTVSKEGRVINAKAVESEPADIFDKAAVKAIEQWTFKPIRKETQARQVIEFALGDE